MGDRPSPVIGLAPAPWISNDWSLSDPSQFPPMIYRGGIRNPVIPVIPEPGTVVLLGLGAVAVFTGRRNFRNS